MKDTIKELIIGLLQIILILLVVFFIWEMVLFVFRYDVTENFQPFEMATVTALLGGFSLVGGFSSNTRLVNLTFTLRKISGLYIIATFAFFLFGLTLPMMSKNAPESLHNQAIPIAVASYYIGAILSASATCWFIWIIRRIFKEN